MSLYFIGTANAKAKLLNDMFYVAAQICLTLAYAHKIALYISV